MGFSNSRYLGRKRCQKAFSLRARAVTDPYEIFVRWYLRLHGYLSVENFVIHEPLQGAVPQGGEIDILAVRFPFSREEPRPGFVLELDPMLIDQAIEEEGLTDFVIAEVKSAKDTLNDLWKPPTSNLKQRRTEYIVRWLGFCDTDAAVEQVAAELQARRTARLKRYRVRLLYFGPAIHPEVGTLGVPQFTHDRLAEFVVSPRASCYRDQGIANRSAHSQWHPLVRTIWSLADPVRPSDRKREEILELLAKEKAGASK